MRRPQGVLTAVERSGSSRHACKDRCADHIRASCEVGSTNGAAPARRRVVGVAIESAALLGCRRCTRIPPAMLSPDLLAVAPCIARASPCGTPVFPRLPIPSTKTPRTCRARALALNEPVSPLLANSESGILRRPAEVCKGEKRRGRATSSPQREPEISLRPYRSQQHGHASREARQRRQDASIDLQSNMHAHRGSRSVHIGPSFLGLGEPCA